MRKKEKVLIALSTVLVVILMNFCVLINSVKAASVMDISQVDLHYGGLCGRYLKYKGVIVKTSYIEYTYNGKSYPAYCMNKTLPGIDTNLSYAVTPNSKIDDLGLWRTVINGYPYKSIGELGVANKEEAFTATKQAIYCYLFENTPNDYEAIGEAGQRTLNALKQIVANAESSTETQKSNVATIKSESDGWQEDGKYIYKIYSVNSQASSSDYTVKFDGNVPEETKITNMKGEEKNKFSCNEKFKVILLKTNLKEDGNFKLDVQTEVKTKPVIFGASPSADWQNYALTGYMYEDANCTYTDTYNKIEEPKKPEKPQTPEPEKPQAEVKTLPVTGY